MGRGGHESCGGRTGGRFRRDAVAVPGSPARPARDAVQRDAVRFLDQHGQSVVRDNDTAAGIGEPVDERFVGTGGLHRGDFEGVLRCCGAEEQCGSGEGAVQPRA